jgi:hypothetical protein
MVVRDLNLHRMFVSFESIASVTFEITGTTVTITGPSPWATLRGTIDLSSGRFTAAGSGTIAGRNNVPVNVDGTITVTGTAGATVSNFTMNVVVGGGGSLPGSDDDGRIRYSVTGRK